MTNGTDPLTQEQIAAAEAERDRLRLENTSRLGTTLNSIAQGLTFGYSDELGAGLASAFMAPFSDETFGEVYARQIEEERGLIKAGQEKYPWLSMGAEIAGGIPTGLGLWKAGTAILKNAPRFARLMGLGAVEGGIYGSGIAEEGGRLEGAARGGGFGTFLGPIGAGIGHVAQRGYQKLLSPMVKSVTQTPKAEARRIVQKSLERDDMTASQVQQEMTELGPEAVLADIQGGNVVGVARSVAGQPGRARSIGENLLNNRQGSQQQRILEAAGIDPNEVGTFRMHVYQMINSRRSNAAPHYREAYKTVLDGAQPRKITITDADGKAETITTSLDEILRLVPKSAVNKAKKLMQGDVGLLEDIKKLFPDTPEGRKAALMAFQNPDMSSLRFYDYLKRALDNQIGRSIRQGAKEEARNLIGQKNRLLDILDDASPAYRRARETFAGEASIRNAVGYGRSLMKNKVDLDEVELALEAMGISEKNAFRQGVIRGLIEQVQDAPSTRNFANNLFITTRMKELLSHAFPDQRSFNTFIRTAMAESRFSNTKNRVLGGSQTAPRLAESADLNKEVAIGHALRTGDPITIGIAALREIGGTDISPETLEAVARILFNRKVPQSIGEQVRGATRDITPVTGTVVVSHVGERVREDVGGESPADEPEIPSTLFQ